MQKKENKHFLGFKVYSLKSQAMVEDMVHLDEFTLEYNMNLEMMLEKLQKIATYNLGKVQGATVEVVEFKPNNKVFNCFPLPNAEENPQIISHLDFTMDSSIHSSYFC